MTEEIDMDFLFVFCRYKYDTVIQVFQNDNLSIAACVDPLKTLDHVPEIQIEPSLEDNKGKSVEYMPGLNIIKDSKTFTFTI